MKTRFWLLVGALVCTSTAVCATVDDVDGTKSSVPEKSKDEIWVNIGGFSSHFNREKGYNENNVGFGIEYRTSPEWAYMAGSYYNSIRQTTTYAAVNWQPFTLGPWKVGAAIGVMDGYPAIERGGTFFAALPMATYESRSFGVNLGVIPNMTNVDGAVIVQFKFRIN
jgi:hypothetical protein